MDTKKQTAGKQEMPKGARDLQPFSFGGGLANTNIMTKGMSLEDTDDGMSFNQFKNKQSSYSDNIYTTSINQANITNQQKQYAERMEKEILNQTSKNIHLQEERGQRDLRDNDDEEALYSGVVREKGKNPKKEKGNSKTTPQKQKSQQKKIGLPAPDDVKSKMSEILNRKMESIAYKANKRAENEVKALILNWAELALNKTYESKNSLDLTLFADGSQPGAKVTEQKLNLGANAFRPSKQGI